MQTSPTDGPFKLQLDLERGGSQSYTWVSAVRRDSRDSSVCSPCAVVLCEANSDDCLSEERSGSAPAQCLDSTHTNVDRQTNIQLHTVSRSFIADERLTM